MDWYVPNDTAEIGSLRRELREHLERHAADGCDIEGATLVASELLTNAIENSDGPVWVSLDWGTVRPVLSVHDLGGGFELDSVAEPGPADLRGRGLMISSKLVASLTVRAKQFRGSIVSAQLPVERPATQNIDPAPSRFAPLPHPDEREADGTFGRDAFLRALVVQLAQNVESLQGPAIAEALVAQVGTDVGGRMEEAFRAARDIDGELDLEQISSLLVELKAAIGGDFFVIDANEDRIVLGNSRCPFGDAVMMAPALCRMTSSVFGGIVRRNRGAAAVDLEQRIAVGDQQCRVTVWLTEPDEERLPFVHRYGHSAAVDLRERGSG